MEKIEIKKNDEYIVDVIDNGGDFEATKRQIGDRLNKWECAVLQAAAVETVSM